MEGADAEGLENLIRSALQAQRLLTFRAESGQVAVPRLVAVVDVETADTAVANQTHLDRALHLRDLVLLAIYAVGHILCVEGKEITIPDLELEILLLRGVPLELDVEQLRLDASEFRCELAEREVLEVVLFGNQLFDLLHRIQIQSRACR